MSLKTLKRLSKRARKWIHARVAKVYEAGADLAPWATIIAALVAVISFYYGYRQFRETQEATRQTLELQRVNLKMQKESLDLERDSKAVELLVKYNDLMREAYRSSPKGEAVFWRDNNAILIAESVFKLTGEDKSWKATVGWLLNNHKAFLKGGLECPTYDDEFIEFVNETMGCNVCSTPVRVPRKPCS